MALVANARKFGANKIHGSFKTHNLTRADKTAWAVFALTIITVCLLLVLGIGRRDTLG
jgi:energy-coupling factor transporter transmembrane protein EcfT